jgi:hypothetical protein
MPKSQTELCIRALNKVGVVGGGQSPAAEDLALVQDALAPLVAELSSLGVVTSIDLSDDTDALEIDDDIFQGVATVLALDIGPEFGKPMASDVDRQSAMNVLRRITACRPTYQVLPGKFY